MDRLELGGADLREIVEEIRDRGLLLVTDRELASVTTLVAGEPVAGSWWSHPEARRIYAVLSELEDDLDLLLVKLVSGKETFVHRALWPELFAVALSRESWQTRGLGALETSVLEEVERAGSLRLAAVLPKEDSKVLRKAVRKLETRLLVHGRQLHTETGAHEKVLSSWKRLARERDVSSRGVEIGAAKAALESRTDGRLPWQRK